MWACVVSHMWVALRSLSRKRLLGAVDRPSLRTAHVMSR